MKDLKDLDKALIKSLEDYKAETIFDIQTYNQSHKKGEYLDEYDLEEISRQVYYLMDDFRKSIIEYLKDNK